MPDRVTHPIEEWLHDPTDIVRGEMRKSVRTRRRILDAGIQLLVDKGYRGFSVSAVATQAGMTRMALLYHFPTRQALLTAIVNHLLIRRIAAFSASLTKVPRGMDEPETRSHAADAAWQQHETPEFVAVSELVAAARTNPELTGVLGPALAAFDRSRHKLAETMFPANRVRQQDFEIARDVVRVMTQGLAMRETLVDGGAERLARLRHFNSMLAGTAEGQAFLDFVAREWTQRGVE